MRKDNDARNHHAAFEIAMREHEDPEATIYKSACIRSYFLKMLQWGHPSACGVARRNEGLPPERGAAARMQGCQRHAGSPVGALGRSRHARLPFVRKRPFETIDIFSNHW